MNAFARSVRGEASDLGKWAAVSDHNGCDGSFAELGRDDPRAVNARSTLSTRGARANVSSDRASGRAGRVPGSGGGNGAEATGGDGEGSIQSFNKAVESAVVRLCRSGAGSSIRLTPMAVATLAECCAVFAAANGPSDCRDKITRTIKVAIPMAPKSIPIAGWVDLQKEGLTRELSF